MTEDLTPSMQIARLIAGEIVAGTLGPGEPVPTVRYLAATYGVASATAQAAHRHLKERGLIEKNGNRLVVAKRRNSDTLVLVQDALPTTDEGETIMARFMIDANRQDMRATGNVEPAHVWVNDPATGKRRTTDQQAVAPNGMPLWQVECLMATENYGRETTEVVSVQVPNPTEPNPELYAPVAFEGLSVVMSVRGGQLRSTWAAEGIKGGGK